MYNFKIVTYEATGEQELVTYSRPIKEGFKRIEKEQHDEEIKQEPTKEYSIEESMRKAEHSLNTSLNRTKQTVYDYARANTWEWFITWTTDPKKVDRHNYQQVSAKFSKWLSNIRSRKAPDLKYVIVPERHKDGAYHFHGLLANTGKMEFVDSGKKAKGMAIYNLDDWMLGFTTATQIQNTLKASNYITKYITKDLIHHTKGRRRYWNSKNLDVGLVHKEMIDNIKVINDLYYESAKRSKKRVVTKADYRNEITYITL